MEDRLGFIENVIKQNVPLAKLTSWQVGGVAEYFSEPTSVEELENALLYANKNNLKVTILGGGTNVLVSDAGIRGLTICLRKFSAVKTVIHDQRLVIKALAGTPKAELLKIFLKHKLSPALFLAGLPGDVGGGVVMNAGVAEQFAPREFGEIVDSVEVIDLHEGECVHKLLDWDDIKWTYRHSIGWQPGVIAEVTLSWPLEPDDQILEKVKEANKSRLTKQPLDMPSCGSVFVNPPGHKAAQLIDSCGLKGTQIGGAQVSLKHANFIVNIGGATAKDILALVAYVMKVVLEKTGVQLRTEVVMLGEWDLDRMEF